mgnify:CR=1 FL=1
MKTIIKLVIAALVLNAVFQYAQVMWDYYQLKDAAQQAVVFGSKASADQIHQQIMRQAASLDVPLKPEDLTVSRVDARTVAEASYTQRVPFAPSYERPMTFTFQVEAFSTQAVAP